MADRAMKGIVYALIVALALTMLMPFLWMLSSSLKPQSEIFRLPPTVIPPHPSLDNFRRLFEQTPFALNLIDTARIDGAGEFRIFTRVIVPVVTPALTSLGIIFFMSSWNSFLWPLVLL